MARGLSSRAWTGRTLGRISYWCPTRSPLRQGKPCNCRLTRHTATSSRLRGRFSSHFLFEYKTTFHYFSFSFLKQFGTGKPCVMCPDKTCLSWGSLSGQARGQERVTCTSNRSQACLPSGSKRTLLVEVTMFVLVTHSHHKSSHLCVGARRAALEDAHFVNAERQSSVSLLVSHVQRGCWATRSNMLTPNSNSQTFSPKDLFQEMKGITFFICSTFFSMSV